jgi:hypothetical protein
VIDNAATPRSSHITEPRRGSLHRPGGALWPFPHFGVFVEMTEAHQRFRRVGQNPYAN